VDPPWLVQVPEPYFWPTSSKATLVIHWGYSLHMCRGITARGCWYVLTRRSILDLQVNRPLEASSNPCHIFPRCTQAAAAKGSWRTGKLGSGHNKDLSGLDPLGQLRGSAKSTEPGRA
jgi:hypothetical protein